MGRRGGTVGVIEGKSTLGLLGLNLQRKYCCHTQLSSKERKFDILLTSPLVPKRTDAVIED